MNIKYQFTYKTRPLDLWELSMYSIYGSLLGTVNIIFTVALIILNMKFFMTVNIVLKAIMIIGVSLFTVIQPILIYLKAKKQVEQLSQEITLSFDDKYMYVNTDGQTSSIPWNKINKIIKKPTLLVIQSSSQHGFILSNKVLGSFRNEFYDFLVSKLNNSL